MQQRILAEQRQGRCRLQASDPARGDVVQKGAEIAILPVETGDGGLGAVDPFALMLNLDPGAAGFEESDPTFQIRPIGAQPFENALASFWRYVHFGGCWRFSCVCSSALHPKIRIARTTGSPARDGPAELEVPKGAQLLASDGLRRPPARPARTGG